MESRHEDILSEIKLGDPQSTLATARQCNIIPDLLKFPMKDEVSSIYSKPGLFGHTENCM